MPQQHPLLRSEPREFAAHPLQADPRADRKAAAEQPMPFLFQPILLRLKREMRDYEQTRRLWE
eukprot:3190095-Prymnesium_polylepis.1